MSGSDPANEWPDTIEVAAARYEASDVARREAERQERAAEAQTAAARHLAEARAILDRANGRTPEQGEEACQRRMGAR